MKQYLVTLFVTVEVDAEDSTAAEEIGQSLASRLEWESLHTAELRKPYSAFASVESVEALVE